MNTSRRTFLTSSAIAGASLLLGSRTASATEPTATPPMDIWDVFKNRRSVRRFKPDPVPEADLRRILDAARLAPTSGNQQPWKFLVVRDPAKIAALKTACIERALGRTDPNKPLSEDEKKQREIRVRSAADEAAARAFMAGDPAIAEKIMTAELHPYRVAVRRR